jgi:hypothetical protein
MASQIINPFSLDLDLNKPADEKILKQTFKDPKEVMNLAYIMKDILEGDNSAAKRQEYAYLNLDQIRSALRWLQENGMSPELQQLLVQKPYSLVFKQKPPTPEEFLGEKYIGQMNEFLWEPMKEQFFEFMNPMNPYRSGIWNTSIGSGKAQPLSSKIYETKTKYFLMSDAKVGDKVLTPFGNQTKINAVIPQGIQPVYKIKTSDGRIARCNLQHLWTISYEKDSDGDKIWKTVTTEFLIKHKNKYKFEIKTIDNNDVFTKEALNCYSPKILSSLWVHH